MKFFRKAHDEPEPDLASGWCPRCSGGREAGLFPCETCSDRRVITYPEWTVESDATLRALVEEGRPWPYIAIVMSPARPIAAVIARSQVLGVRSPRGEPSPSVVLRAGDGHVVDLHDPARKRGW